MLVGGVRLKSEFVRSDLLCERVPRTEQQMCGCACTVMARM
jgi:hypothetical protein